MQKQLILFRTTSNILCVISKFRLLFSLYFFLVENCVWYLNQSRPLKVFVMLHNQLLKVPQSFVFLTYKNLPKLLNPNSYRIQFCFRCNIETLAKKSKQGQFQDCYNKLPCISVHNAHQNLLHNTHYTINITTHFTLYNKLQCKLCTLHTAHGTLDFTVVSQDYPQ